MSAAPLALPALGSCPPVSVNHTFTPADVGPHFNHSGELWWYLGALDRDDGGGLVGVQLSFFRKSSDNCTDASRNDVISTLAIGLPPSRYVQTTRIAPAINVSRWRAEPGVWGVEDLRDPEKLKKMSGRTARNLAELAKMPAPDTEGISEYSHRGQRRHGVPFTGGNFGDFIRNG